MEQRPRAFAEAAAGDPDSFSSVIEPLLDQAYRLAAVMLGDRHAAEDAVQEAAIKAWRKARQLRATQSVRPWFLSIVANECRMAKRARWWGVIKLAEVTPANRETSPDGNPDLHRALMRLPAADRLPLVLHFYLDLPLEELARTLGVSPAAAKSRVYRAAKRLRADLTIEEVF